MAENSKISQIKLPNGSTYDIKDNTSGYTNNIGTITSVKTTAGAHTTINVSSGAAEFNVPTKTSHLTNDSGFLTSFTETDPTVPAWAKADTKPSYTFSEIGSTPTTLSGYGITNAYTKTEIDGLVAGVLHYKGTKASVANLPSTGNVTGDVWHITADGSEYAWDGSIWQELGTAVDLSGYALSSEIPTTAQNATTGITIADHSTTTIYGVTSNTTAVRGVKTGTNSTTTASKASGANGTAPTLGTPISIWGVKSGTNSTTTASKVTVGSHATDYGVKSAGSGSYTQGSFSGGSLVVTSHILSFTPATHGADSHTHTAPTLGSKVPTVSASDVTVPIREDEATSVPNVTSAGSASTWSFTDVTVPIRADADTTVPVKDSGTTVVTSKTHSITDNGHTHTLD